MLFYVFLAVSAIFSIVLSVCCFSGAALLWMIPIFIGTFIVIVLIYCGFVALVSVFIDTEKKPEKYDSFFTKVTISALDFFVTLAGGKIHVNGREKMPTVPYLMVLNHRSLMDPVSGLIAFKKDKLTFVSKQENQNIPVIGKYLHAIGTLTLDREDARKALKTINEAADMIKDGKASIAICPEGTRNRTENNLLEFHHGSFKIAQKAKCPLVVACYRNTDQLKKHPVFKRTDIYIDILGVKMPDELDSLRTSDMSDWAWNLIDEHLRSVKA